MSQSKKSLQDLTLLDRFLFAEVMEDPRTFENVLSIILGKDISIQGNPQSEHEFRTSPLKRQVRLDIWAEDEDDSVYNVEAQKENTKNLPHRSRFYQALKDGAIRIFLNTHGNNSNDTNPELIELLHFMEYTTEETSCSTSRLQEIKEQVNLVKSSEEIGVKYMQEWEEKILEKRKARAEGLAEGRAEGDCSRLIQLIKKKIKKSKTLLQIADELEEDVIDIQPLYEYITEHLDEETDTICKQYLALNNPEK